MQILESRAVDAAADAAENRTNSNCTVVMAADAAACDGDNPSELIEPAFESAFARLVGIPADQQPTTIYKTWRGDCAVAYFIGSEAEVIARLNAL